MATKLTLGFVFLVILITVFAQTPSFFGSSTTPTTDSSSAGNKTVMSPQQFQNTVSSLNQQSMNQINQQLKQQHAEQRYPTSPTVSPTPEIPSASAPPSQPVPPPPTALPPNLSAPQPPTSAAPGQIPAPPVQPAQNTGSTATPTPPPPPPPQNYSVQPAPAKPGQSEVYRGFGTGQEKNAQQPPAQNKSSTGSSGGWNINY